MISHFPNILYFNWLILSSTGLCVTSGRFSLLTLSWFSETGCPIKSILLFKFPKILHRRPKPTLLMHMGRSDASPIGFQDGNMNSMLEKNFPRSVSKGQGHQ